MHARTFITLVEFKTPQFAMTRREIQLFVVFINNQWVHSLANCFCPCPLSTFQMMRAYPSSIAQHAISAAKVLIKYEQQQGSKLGSLNPLRRMLILELMPLILSKGLLSYICFWINVK